MLTEFGPSRPTGSGQEFEQRLLFAGGGFDSDDPGQPARRTRPRPQPVGGRAQLVHYLAIPPVGFEEVTKGLGAHGLAAGARVVYEKPFGTSPEGFRSLDRVVHSVLNEDQVYRIDHFLGKEATQNLHVLRFANEMIGGDLGPSPRRVGADRRARAARYHATGPASTTPPARCSTWW